MPYPDTTGASNTYTTIDLTTIQNDQKSEQLHGYNRSEVWILGKKLKIDDHCNRDLWYLAKDPNPSFVIRRQWAELELAYRGELESLMLLFKAASQRMTPLYTADWLATPADKEAYVHESK